MFYIGWCFFCEWIECEYFYVECCIDCGYVLVDCVEFDEVECVFVEFDGFVCCFVLMVFVYVDIELWN